MSGSGTKWSGKRFFHWAKKKREKRCQAVGQNGRVKGDDRVAARTHKNQVYMGGSWVGGYIFKAGFASFQKQ